MLEEEDGVGGEEEREARMGGEGEEGKILARQRKVRPQQARVGMQLQRYPPVMFCCGDQDLLLPSSQVLVVR
jgi:hypothetical protein